MLPFLKCSVGEAAVTASSGGVDCGLEGWHMLNDIAFLDSYEKAALFKKKSHIQYVYSQSSSNVQSFVLSLSLAHAQTHPLTHEKSERG